MKFNTALGVGSISLALISFACVHPNANAAGFSTPFDALPGVYGYNAGAWRVDQHLRLLNDVNNDGRADIVGFGNGGVSVALGQQDGSFGQPSDVITGRFGYDEGRRMARGSPSPDACGCQRRW